MYDANKIVTGLIIFIGLVTLPIWYGLLSAEAAQVPELVIITDEEECVEPAEYMRNEHMELVEDWRESAIRKGERTYLSSEGKEYEMSLTGTCLSCHSNKTEFCDQCHNYVAVKPSCWDCHNVPESALKDES